MDTIMKADIFFFISSVAIIFLALLSSIALFFLIKFTRSLYYFLEEIKEHFKDSEEFVRELKDRFEGNVLFRFLFPMVRKRKSSRKKNTNNNSKVA